MAKIKPFKAIFYNQEKIKDLSRVVCPPYDVISPAAQEYLHNLSPYNLIHILLGKRIPGQDKYRRAKEYFKDWMKDKTLMRDDTPAVYFYSQQYHLRGEKRTRLGFISLLHLGHKSSSVFGHEHTRLEPKEDRLRLLKQVKANLSPIFAVFLDKKRIIQHVYLQCIQGQKPFIELIDAEKIKHSLWRLTDKNIIDRIQERMKDENIFIADGHHRYEVACAFRDQLRARRKHLRAEEPFDYILSYFTNTDSRGLAILPVHRLIKTRACLNINGFLLGLSEYFDIREIKEKTKFFFSMEKGGRTEHVLGMYKNKKFWLLRLKSIRILDKLMSDNLSAYRSLDVSILNGLILNRILGMDLENKEHIKCGPNADEFIEEADKDAGCIAFFLNPVRIEQVIAVASQGERMPSKSTYFYPKVLSGLVINKFED